MTTQSRIDILLGTYNGERFVERQIESILDQMDDRCRLLVRDDGSTDRTVLMVRQFARQHPRQIRLLNDAGPRLGPCGNFGRLLEHSDADYVVLCDQDDVWRPGRIALPLERLQAIERRLGVDTPALVHTDLVVVDENLRTIAPSFWAYSRISPRHGGHLNRLLVQNVVTGCATMINRSLARLASPIPANVQMHDWWLALVAAAFGRVEAIPQATVLYRQHDNNQLGAVRYDWRYVLGRAKEMFRCGDMMRRFHETQRQAAAFGDRFAASLPQRDEATVAAYLKLDRAGFLNRRMQLLRHGFLKTGWLRNLGWLIVI